MIFLDALIAPEPEPAGFPFLEVITVLVIIAIIVVVSTVGRNKKGD